MTKYLEVIKKEIDETELSAVSKKVIKSTLNKIEKMNKTSGDEYKNPNDLIKLIKLFLKNNENLNTSHTFIAHIKSILKHTTLKDMISEADQNEIEKLFLKYKNLKERKDDAEEPSKKHQENYIPYEDLVKKYKQVKDKLNWKDKLMYGLYVLQPPLRADYGDVKLILDSDDTDYSDINNNYFLIDKMKMIINQYKSNKVMNKNGDFIHKPLIFDVDDDVYDLIYDSIETRLKEDEEIREYLIEDRFGKAMKSNTLSKNITRISMLLFGKPIGIQEIRTIYCSRFQLQDEDCAIESIIADANKMGHSISTHIKKYMKLYLKPK
tara:strand:- start:34 stop:1002 length:969 start_codon:yes stop_codon:yes gene_type:complete